MSKYTRSAKITSRRQTLILGVISLLILGLAAAAAVTWLDARGGGESTAVLAANRQIDVQEAYQLYQEGAVAEAAEEYRQGHIPGAALIPLSDLAARAGELPAGEPIMIYCRSGNRSLQALQLLEGAGFEGLTSMDGGFNQWVAAGYPAEFP